jgi:amidase
VIEDVLDLDGLAQAEHIKRGDVTAAELVRASIARIERSNPALNAVIHPLFDKAMAQVQADEIGDGAFRGVPFVVKDAVCHTAGDPFHCGMRVLKEFGYTAREDTELARRFRAAGFVFVGKTNTPELAMSATTEPLAYGPTHNPWSLEHSSGGSSGGSAAAVASRMVAAGHANDMGGSIRVPASFCGLVGLKPTRARSTLAPKLGEYWGPLTHEHVVCRSVRDSAAILDAIAGPALGDPYSAPPPDQPFLDALSDDPGRLRIGLVHQIGETETHPDCLRALHAAAGFLEEMGHRIAPISLPTLGEAVLGPWIPAGLARDLDRWSAVIGRPIGEEDVEPFNWLMAEAGRALNAAQFIEQSEVAFDWGRRFCNEWQSRADVLLMPTAPTPPPKLGELSPTIALPDLARGLGHLTCFTMPFDLTGQPALSLPMDWNPAGLPIGVQLAAATGREDLLFQLAARLEEARPWIDRRPAA